MAIQTKTTLKSFFNLGDIPSESNFADLIDTLVNYDPSGNVGIGTTAPGTKLQIGPTTGDGASSGILLQSESLDKGSIYWSKDVGFRIDTYRTSDGRRLPILLQPDGGNVGIGTTNPLAGLDIYSTNVLPIRITDASTEVFSLNTASSNNHYINVGGTTTVQVIGNMAYFASGAADGTYLGANSHQVGLGIAPEVASALTISSQANTRKGLVVRGVSSQTANLIEWQDSTGLGLGVIDSFGNVGIGTPTPNANAILDITSTTKAFMPPRMTTVA